MDHALVPKEGIFVLEASDFLVECCDGVGVFVLLFEDCVEMHSERVLELVLRFCVKCAVVVELLAEILLC